MLTPDQRREALTHLPDWRYSMHAFRAAYEAASAADAIALVVRITELAAEQTEHVFLDWRDRHVFVGLRSTALAGVDAVDAELAAAISNAAAGRASARPDLCRVVEIAVDTDDPGRLSATWAAALGYDVDDEGDLLDPFRRGPAVWFQQTPSPAESRFHIDVTVADDLGDQVLDATVEAGGRRIDDRFRPSFTVVADPDGNRLCICTQLGRD